MNSVSRKPIQAFPLGAASPLARVSVSRTNVGNIRSGHLSRRMLRLFAQ
jgi:hypothetical protein